MRIFIGLCAILIASVGAVVTDDAHASGDQPDKTSPVITWISNRPCAEEDSVNCAWNAQEQGNGTGHSFIVRHFKGRNLTCYMYDQRAYAKKHDHCIKG